MLGERKKKLLLKVVYLVCFLVVNVQVVQAITNHWSKNYIEELSAKEILDFTERDEKSLDELVTEKELYGIINKILGKSTIKANMTDSFITRERAAVIIAKEFKLKGEKELDYIDSEKVSDFAASSVKKLNYIGILHGYPDGSFRPQSFITHAEMYKFLSKFDPVKDQTSNNDISENSEKQEIEKASIERTPLNESYTESYSNSESHGMYHYLGSSGQAFQNENIERYAELSDIQKSDVSELSPHEAKRIVELSQVNSDSVPVVKVTGKMGSVFRSVDIQISVFDDNSAPEIYYIARLTGSEVPSAETIIKYGNTKQTHGLSDGSVVRGKWFSSTNEETNTLTLLGSEGLDAYRGELGFIDGYNYDLHFVALDSKGQTSEVSSIYNIMAMPFSAKSADERTFTIKEISKQDIEKYKDLKSTHIMNDQNIDRTARQLENIQRLAELYKETNGVHGNMEFLTSSKYTYVLGSSIDLSEYAEVNEGTGFLPIGNVEKDRAFVFRGSFYGNTFSIKNLYIKRNAQYQGLFGKIQNANISHLTLENPILFVLGNVGKEYALSGSLVAFAQNSNIDRINVNNATVKAYSYDTQQSASGGVVGYAENTNISNVNVKNMNLATYNPKDTSWNTDVSGGVVAVYKNTRNENKLLKNIDITGEISSHGKYVGGIVGTLENDSDSGKVIAENLTSNVTIESTSDTGGGIVGIVFSENSEKGVITFSNCYFMGEINVGKTSGGVVGMAIGSSYKNIIFKNSSVTGKVHSYGKGSSIGGFCGLATSASFENCNSAVEQIDVANNNVGGFIGIISGNSNVINCGTNTDVIANGNIGGFVGAVLKESNFENSYSSGDVFSTSKNAGGFVGRLNKDKISFNNCLQFGKLIHSKI